LGFYKLLIPALESPAVPAQYVTGLRQIEFDQLAVTHAPKRHGARVAEPVLHPLLADHHAVASSKLA
jgi:hypothetical protein